jgi:hypothetical protein
MSIPRHVLRRGSCWTCVFWQNVPIDRPFTDFQEEGLCRRRAPTGIPSRSVSDAGEDETGIQGLVTAWPRTFQEDWCGEYRAACDVRGRDKEEDQEEAA